MTPEQVLLELPITAWQGPFDPGLCQRALDALEAGQVLKLAVPFVVTEAERARLTPSSLGGARKNISLDPRSGRLGNTALRAGEQALLADMMQRFADTAAALLADLLPGYARQLQRARTSFRPAEIAGRSYSARHDDRLLHVDAFPTRPLRGRRILRLFTNVAPDGAPREWCVGEPFEAFAARFLPQVKRPWPGSATVLSVLRLTSGRRSPYDAMMLALHDAAKHDAAYQAAGPKAAATFPPGTTWVCFTDQVLHAALAGHCALEQTFHVPPDVMAHPEQAPLHVLQRLTGRALA